MAITKETTVLGILISDAYYNIQSATTSKNEDGLYNVELLVNEYTDSTKENHVSQKGYTVKGLKEDSLNYSTYYAKLKLEEEFTGSSDA